MKTKSFAVIVSGTAAAVLCLFGACCPQTLNAQTGSTPAPAPNDSTAPGAPDDSSALPPNVDPASPLAQVIKLTQAGVSEDVIMAYVTNSTSPFNLNPDEIIYLKDIGAPDEAVTAMIQRDQMLAASGNPPPQPAPATTATVADATYVAPPPTVVTVDYFYNTLAPYGSWVYVEGYGRCWRPTVTVVNAGWQPYCDHGHWVWTDDGWFWISDYSWGWAPFHYGRWFRDARIGWCWYPDTVWGPSWVTWRYSGDYCGWAPLPPRCVYREGVGFFYNGAAVSVGFDFGLGANYFTFVRTRDFCDPHPWRHRIERREVSRVFEHTTVINRFGEDRRNRTFINHGIDPQHITEVTHAPIRPVAIHETTGPVARGEQLGRDGRTLMVNRPHFSDNPSQFQNRGESPRAVPPAPRMGSPYQPLHNGNENNNSRPRLNQPAPRPAQRQFPPVAAPGSPVRSQMTQPTERSPSPGHRSAPVAPVRPVTPNNNATDNRRYPSPRMQQVEPQNPRANPGNAGGRVVAPVTPQMPASPPAANRFSPPAQPPQRSYRAPVTTPTPPARPPEASRFNPPAQRPAPAQPPQRSYGAPVMAPSPPARQPEANRFIPPAQRPAPAPPPQRSYVSPRNETPPSASRPNYSQPPRVGNQPHSASPPPAQSQGSGRNRNQNGH